MTSFGANEISEGNFMPSFKIQGQSDQISIRTNMIPNLKRGLIESLQTVLRENNHLIQSFRSNLESRSFDELQNFKLIIHADRVPQDEHRGQYNAPTIDEVAVLLVNEDKGPRDIVLHGRSGHLSRVSELNRSYDALQYPLMYTRGEDGYHINILQVFAHRHGAIEVKIVS
ncbi:hypothetical protein QTP88_001753 [Uroleucon formosanum]